MGKDGDQLDALCEAFDDLIAGKVRYGKMKCASCGLMFGGFYPSEAKEPFECLMCEARTVAILQSFVMIESNA